MRLVGLACRRTAAHGVAAVRHAWAAGVPRSPAPTMMLHPLTAAPAAMHLRGHARRTGGPHTRLLRSEPAPRTWRGRPWGRAAPRSARRARTTRCAALRERPWPRRWRGPARPGRAQASRLPQSQWAPRLARAQSLKTARSCRWHPRCWWRRAAIAARATKGGTPGVVHPRSSARLKATLSSTLAVHAPQSPTMPAQSSPSCSSAPGAGEEGGTAGARGPPPRR